MVQGVPKSLCGHRRMQKAVQEIVMSKRGSITEKDLKDLNDR